MLERHIEASDIHFTYLRPNWFMQNFDSGPFLADIQSSGALHLPAADAKLSFIDVRDIAAVGLAALTDPVHLCRAYTLTGGEALDHATAMSIISGRQEELLPMSRSAKRQHVRGWLGQGFPPTGSSAGECSFERSGQANAPLSRLPSKKSWDARPSGLRNTQGIMQPSGSAPRSESA